MIKNNYILNFIAILAIFMEMLDSTILNTAIPSMAISLQVSPINLKIALISYLLMLAIFIPISGWMADKWGAKKIFLLAMLIFTLSSLICGFSTNLLELIIMRCFQGIGGAFMVPIARLLIIRSVPRSEIVNVMGRIMICASLAIMLGPVLGGLITEYLSWSWIFFLNVPIGILALLLTYYQLEETELLSVPPFDVIGFLLFGFGLALFIFGLSYLSENELSLHDGFITIVIALILLTIYFIYSKRKPHAIVNIRLFKFHTFTIGALGGLFGRIGFGGMPFLLPLLFQLVFAYTPAESGLLLAPMALGVMAAKFIAANLLHSLRYRRYLILNTILVSFSILSFVILTPKTSWITIAILTFIFGILVSQQYSAMNSLAYQEVERAQLSSATSFMATIQQFSQSFGVAIAALLLQGELLLFKSNSINLVTFRWTFIILSLLTLSTVFIYFKLRLTTTMLVR